MVEKAFIQEALQRVWALDESPDWKPDNPATGQSSIISQLIYDIYGGEILKTPKNKSWHFYNRINGELIDFTRSEMDQSIEDRSFEDLPTSPDETHRYFAQEDYSTFSRRFVRAFEYAVYQEKYPSVLD